MDLEGKLVGFMENILVQQRHRLAIYAEQLKGLSPLDKLSQGYAYVEDMQHRVVNDVHCVRPEDTVCIYVRNGIVQAKVKSCREIANTVPKEISIDCFEREVKYGEGADIGTDI